MTWLEDPAYRACLSGIWEGLSGAERLDGKTLLLSGGSGMLGSLLIDALLLRNRSLPPERRCAAVAVARNAAPMKERFAQWGDDPALTLLAHDMTAPLPPLPRRPDYLIHAASTTHPLAYATEPIATIMTNVLGARHMLELAAACPGSRFLLLSSVEIYGEARDGAAYFDEGYCGYIDCNTLRAGYPEAKRVSEALCQAYIAQKRVDAVILRLARCYGPTMRPSDSKASAQFIKKAVRGEDVVLKSKGEQRYSYAYAADAVSGLLCALLHGETGQAYNLSDEGSDVTLREFAELAAEYAGTAVTFELPDEREKRGYSTATRALLRPDRLKALGWRARYDVRTGLRETIDILRRRGEL